MIQAKRLGHVVLNVRNAEKSRDFYTQTLGLKVAHENLERGAVFLSFGKEHHGAGRNPRAGRRILARLLRRRCPHGADPRIRPAPGRDRVRARAGSPRARRRRAPRASRRRGRCSRHVSGIRPARESRSSSRIRGALQSGVAQRGRKRGKVGAARGHTGAPSVLRGGTP